MARITTAVLAILLAGPASLGIAKAQDVPAASVEPLLSTGETVLGQTITYPTATAAHVTAVIVTLPPGAETGWHQHDVPLFGYLLEGQLTVDYEGVGERIYRPGDPLMEAIGTSHNGRNMTGAPVRILAVFVGAEDIPNTVAAK